MVVVVQAAQEGVRDNVTASLYSDPSLLLAWYSLLNPLVRARVVEILLVLLHYAMQVPVVQDHKVVQALSTHASQKSFTDRICLRRSVRCAQYLNACA